MRALPFPATLKPITYLGRFKHGRKKGRSLGSSFAEVLDSPASRIYACFTKLGRLPMADAGLVHEMVRLAFDLDAEGTERYLYDIGDRLKRVDKKAR